MTDAYQAPPPKKRRAIKYTKHRTQIGIGLDFATRQVRTRSGRKVSMLGGRLIQHYEEALAGNVRSTMVVIRAIMRNLDAAEKQGLAFSRKSREEMDPDYEPEWVRKLNGSYKSPPDPTNADLAILVLGIAAVGNEAMERLGQPGDGAYESKLKTLAPDRFEPWFLELMIESSETSGGSPSLERQLREELASGRTHLGSWDGARQRLLADLMRVRGPGATRFAPGQSGNLAGRPRQPQVELPYDGALMEMVSIPVQGKMRKVSRLDAFIYKLSTMPVKKSPTMAAHLTELLMRLYEAGWEPSPEVPVIIEI